VLFPAAARVDEEGVLPASHLDALADAGFYGLTGPESLGGAPHLVADVVEALASGCLATTFVWLQHLGVVRFLAESSLGEAWLEPMCRGAVRAATVQAALRPGPASVRATAVPDGFIFDGEAPWVTGWGLVDVMLVAARQADDMVVWALVDARDGPGIVARTARLSAVRASNTVQLSLHGFHVPAARVAAVTDFAQWPARDALGLRTNGSLALGLAGRCLVLGSSPHAAAWVAALSADLAACRVALSDATPEQLPAARAAASELAWRAAGSYAVSAGAVATLAGSPAERLVREAAFLLVFGSRPAIRTRLTELVAARPHGQS
jgi:alkylation response protein AidB-like acyl-CoA dehydrogenase